MQLKRAVLAAMIALAWGAAARAEFKLNVKEHKLDNGLVLLVLENRTTPVVTYYTFYKVGARNEIYDNSGVSHFFEHMMFNGARKYGPKMFDQTLESKGGRNNAYTSQNVTAYYEDFPTDALELVFDLESDRMDHLDLSDQSVSAEAGVVSEERLVGVDNDNEGIMYEELLATAYVAHPYGAPVIGWMESIKHFNKVDCQEYFDTYYAPNNAVVAIVGDIQDAATLTLAQTYLAPLPAGTPPPGVPRYEPEQRGAKRVFMEREAEHEHLMRGYHVGDKDSPDRYVLEVIQFLLTTGESCRLHQTLVNDLQVALYLYGGFEWGIDPSLFYYYVAVTPGTSHDRAEQAFDSVLSAFASAGPTPQELQKAKFGLTANFYKNFKTNNGTAHELARFQTLYGDWKRLYEYVPGVDSVSAEQVKETMAKYFVPKNSTTVILVPEEGES